jgi:hypothetical protein
MEVTRILTLLMAYEPTGKRRSNKKIKRSSVSAIDINY